MVRRCRIAELVRVQAVSPPKGGGHFPTLLKMGGEADGQGMEVHNSHYLLAYSADILRPKSVLAARSAPEWLVVKY